MLIKNKLEYFKVLSVMGINKIEIFQCKVRLMKIKYIFIFCLLFFLLHGCATSDPKEEIEYFNNQIAELLSDEDLLVIEASQLTNFSWDTLCFERNGSVKLKFNTDKFEVVFELNFKDYFIDEPYVDGSLAGKCISSDTQILVKRKYPQYSNIVEFQKVN